MIPDWLAHWLLNWLSLEPLLRRWNLAHYPLLGAHHVRHSHSSMTHFFTGFPRPVPEDWCVGLISGSSSLSRTPEFWVQNYCGPTWAAHTVPAPRCWLTLACHFPQQPTTVPTVALGLNTILANSLLSSHSVFAVTHLGTVPMRHWPYCPPNSLLAILGFQPRGYFLGVQ